MKRITQEATLLSILITVTFFQKPVWANDDPVVFPEELPQDLRLYIYAKAIENNYLKNGAAFFCTERLVKEARECAKNNFKKKHGDTLNPLLDKIKKNTEIYIQKFTKNNG